KTSCPLARLKPWAWPKRPSAWPTTRFTGPTCPNGCGPNWTNWRPRSSRARSWWTPPSAWTPAPWTSCATPCGRRVRPCRPAVLPRYLSQPGSRWAGAPAGARTRSAGSVAMPDLLRMESITKVYPNGVVANRNVTFSVQAGEVHALVGENGAGKTTLMKILFGLEQPDDGTIFFEGRQVRIPSPHAAIAMGIGMVHQHFMLAPSLTVAENIVLGAEPRRGPFLDAEAAIQRTEELARKYNLPVDPRARIRDIPVGMRQKVEILKTLYRGARLLVLDEPTAVLTPQETVELFAALENLRRHGHTIIFISHKLREVKQISDRVTIMRRGQVVGVTRTADVTEADISRMMVGRDVVMQLEKPPANPTHPVLRVEGL